MASAPPATFADPGPPWMWLTAWSLQGLVVLGANAIGVEGDVARFLLMGAVAGVPLASLYWVLRNRRPR